MSSFIASLRTLCVSAFIALSVPATALAVPVFANGQGISCESCHTTFPGMTRYGMSVMMTNFQILNAHLQDQALPVSARLYITSLLANRDHPGSTMVDDLSLLGGGFAGRNFTWYGEQHVVDGGVPGQTEQLWLSWNGLLNGTNSLQVGKFHTPFPFMPAHAWTISPYLLATQTTGQNPFNPNDARWGVAFNGMSNEFMYNLSWLAGSGPTSDLLNYNKTSNPRTLDLNVGYGGMRVPWSIGMVAMRGSSPVNDPASGAFLTNNAFTREGLYVGYQDSAWHYQSMFYHGMDANPDTGLADVPLNGFFFEAERDLGWRNHILMRYDVASSTTLNRQLVVDLAHNIAPNLAVIGEVAGYPGSRPAVSMRLAYAGPYEGGKRFLKTLHFVPAGGPAATTPPAAADANDGAKLVQANGCAGCHGAALNGGGIGPALYGIERKLPAAQIADFITHPRAPMPDFGFSAQQVGDIVAYLSNLDGGGAGQTPVVSFNPGTPTDQAVITVRFPGAPPKEVSVVPAMEMGKMAMQTRIVHLTQSASDPHVFSGPIVFSMGGPWNIQVQYDGKTLDVPLNVGQ